MVLTIEVKNEIRKNLQKVEIIQLEGNNLKLIFAPGTIRQGNELQALKKIFYDYKIFGAIFNEKVDFWTNEILSIGAAIY